MKKTIVRVISICLMLGSFLVGSFALKYIGVSQYDLVEASKFSGSGEQLETLSASDGGLAKVSCRTNGIPIEVSIRCNSFVGTDFLVRLDVVETQHEKYWEQNIRLKLVPRLADQRREEAIEKAVVLSSTELETRTFTIASVHHGYRNLYTHSNYDVGTESIKALLASDLRKASEIYERELSRVDIERIAELNSGILTKYIGSFKVRKDITKMILQGSMEYLILSLGICAAVYLFWGAALTYIFRQDEEGHSVIWQSSSLGGALTYLGLLGTLIGMFGTVIDLSAIDFVDEMRKVFDQTESFGSMALAIGTSVVGLTGSVIVWMLHILFSVLTGKRM